MHKAKVLHQRRTCERKRRYDDWETARLAGLAVWLEAPHPDHQNMPLPYPCTLIGEPHYHVGHLRPRGWQT